MYACCAWNCDPKKFTAKFSSTLLSRTTFHTQAARQYTEPRPHRCSVVLQPHSFKGEIRAEDLLM